MPEYVPVVDWLILPVRPREVPSNVRFALLCRALVPFPYGIRFAVSVVSPVPPFATGSVPVTALEDARLIDPNPIEVPDRLKT